MAFGAVVCTSLSICGVHWCTIKDTSEYRGIDCFATPAGHILSKLSLETPSLCTKHDLRLYRRRDSFPQSTWSDPSDLLKHSKSIL